MHGVKVLETGTGSRDGVSSVKEALRLEHKRDLLQCVQCKGGITLAFFTPHSIVKLPLSLFGYVSEFDVLAKHVHAPFQAITSRGGNSYGVS